MTRLTSAVIAKRMWAQSFKSILVKLVFEPSGVKITGSGYLNDGVADVGNLFECFGEILKCLAMISESKKLSTYFHFIHLYPLKFS